MRLFLPGWSTVRKFFCRFNDPGDAHPNPISTQMWFEGFLQFLLSSPFGVCQVQVANSSASLGPHGTLSVPLSATLSLETRKEASRPLSLCPLLSTRLPVDLVKVRDASALSLLPCSYKHWPWRWLPASTRQLEGSMRVLCKSPFLPSSSVTQDCSPGPQRTPKPVFQILHDLGLPPPPTHTPLRS